MHFWERQYCISGNCLLCSLTEQQSAAWLFLWDELSFLPFSIFFLLHLNWLYQFSIFGNVYLEAEWWFLSSHVTQQYCKPSQEIEFIISNVNVVSVLAVSHRGFPRNGLNIECVRFSVKLLRDICIYIACRSSLFSSYFVCFYYKCVFCVCRLGPSCLGRCFVSHSTNFTPSVPAWRPWPSSPP